MKISHCTTCLALLVTVVAGCSSGVKDTPSDTPKPSTPGQEEKKDDSDGKKMTTCREVVNLTSCKLLGGVENREIKRCWI